MNRLSRLLIIGISLSGLLFQGCGDDSPAATVDLASIEIAPQNPTLAKETTQQFKATGILTDGTKQDFTDKVVWTSSDESIATLSAAGLATAVKAGTTTVKATYQGLSADTLLTVTDATLTSVEVSPATSSIAISATQQYTATALFSDGTKQDVTKDATWASSDAAVATISITAGSEGLATGVKLGTATISAEYKGSKGEAQLTVSDTTVTSVEVTPATTSLAVAATQQYTATALFSDGTKKDVTKDATWKSSDESIATLSTTAGSEGLTTALTTGSATISAEYMGSKGDAKLTVTGATITTVDVTPISTSLAISATQQYTAMAIFSDGTKKDVTTTAVWKSSDTSIATISSTSGTEGLATAVKAGTTTITADYMGLSGGVTLTVTAATLQSVEISPATAKIAASSTQQYTATAIYSDGTKQVVTTDTTWTSSDSTIAEISNAAGTVGLTKTYKAGSVTISATYKTLKDSATLEVTAATLKSLEVTPTLAKIATGTTQQYAATAIYSDGTKQDVTTVATWTSSDATIAEISNTAGLIGQAKGHKAGKVVITAAYGTLKATADLTVTTATLKSIEIAPTSATISKGAVLQYSATALYSDGTKQNVTKDATWASSDPTIASISNAAGTIAVATGASAGDTTISAVYKTLKATAKLTVTSAVLKSLEIAPSSTTIATGSTQQYTATAIYSDGSKQNVTKDTTWKSSDPKTADISNAPASVGLAKGYVAGGVTISATYKTFVDQAKLTVTAATLKSVEVTPASDKIAVGTTLQYTATAIYSDGTKKNVTTSATWKSSDTAIADISNASGSEGLAKSVKAGTVKIEATFGGLSGTAELTVTAATLKSVEVTPTSDKIAVGTTLQYTATAIYSDGTKKNVTTAATWKSSDTAIATISNASGSEGLAKGVKAGKVKFEAAFGGLSGIAELTVTAATLKSVEV
ncbi:MAG: Ig-like domain-containing protein, partial [Deltaproteobacteria bacterium]|nr:Ig-like domain-containing protein [Deltaproteobacteria bacterium]